MPKLEVIGRALRYAKVEYKAGETFEASDKDAKVLKAVKRAKDAAAEAPKPVAAPRPAVETRVMTPEVPVSSDDGDSSTTRRRYRRNDMRAED